MCERAGIILSAIFVGLLSLNVSMSPAASTSAASADAKSRFDLPAGPLDKALRDLAVQANRNISYEPSIVAGLSAPAIKGKFTVGGALSLMLTGTNLRAVSINDNTIQILEKTTGAKQAATTSRKSSNSSGTGSVTPATATPEAPELASPGTVATRSDPNDSAVDKGKSPDNKGLEEIVVTGTHIRGASTASPVIEIGREEIDRSGSTSVADLMLSLPQNFGGGYSAASSVGNSQINNRYADNPTGATVPNLRGLGPGSTLTLVDGHRMAEGLIGGGADISSIPIDAIERIEVITDGASAIYGSDAVAGVVNVILKRNYSGAETSLSYGFAPEGGGTEKRVSQLFGTHWNGGDALVAYEHAQQDTVDARDRDFTLTALEPNTLLPKTKSNSLTLSASQDLSEVAAAFVDGLYIARDADRFTTTPYSFAPADQSTSLRKYAVAAGLNFNFARDWKGTVFVNAAEDATDSNGVYLTKPAATPGAAEDQFGAIREVEASANGRIAELPTGIVQLAVGAGYRREEFSDTIGFTPATLQSSADANRNVRYAFGELSIPLVQHSLRPGLNALDLVVSGRSERYSDFGEKAVPKLGLVYVPTSSVKFRSTWGKAYKAPDLYDLGAIQQLAILDLPNFSSPSGSSTALLRVGGNPSLQPETANEWSIGADFSPPELAGLQASTTLFHIKYTNRISFIDNPFTALTDPLNAFFVTPSPSASVAQSVYGSYPPDQVFNQSGANFDPSKIGAIVDDRAVNVASQTARGADLNIGYRIGTGSSSGMVFFNGTYLDLTQQNTPQSPVQSLTGLAFYPPKFRLRGGATWKLNAWALTGTVNYLPGETNNQVTPLQSVGSWTTVDASLRFTPAFTGVLSGMHLSLSAVNLFDKDPPYIVTSIQGLNYDSSNTNPTGRFITLQISKEW